MAWGSFGTVGVMSGTRWAGLTDIARHVETVPSVVAVSGNARPGRVASGGFVLVARRGADVHALAVAAVHAEDLDRLVAGRAEPVRQAGVELGDLARLPRDVVLAQDQPHLAREHVEPLIARVGAEPALPFGRDDDLPHRHPAGLLCEGIDEPAVARARPGADARVTDPRRADELVKRQMKGVGQRQQELKARLALAVLQSRERALRDPGLGGQRRQRQPAAFP